MKKKVLSFKTGMKFRTTSTAAVDPLEIRVREYLEMPGMGQVIVDATDLIMRLRLGQLNSVCDVLTKYCSISQEGKGVSIDEILYKALELGELMKCQEKYKQCKFAESCWITRKAFCKLEKDMKI